MAGRFVIRLRSGDPDDLTLREARLLGRADVVVADAGVPQTLLVRARADALRLAPNDLLPEDGVIVVLRQA